MNIRLSDICRLYPRRAGFYIPTSIIEIYKRCAENTHARAQIKLNKVKI